MQYGTYVLNNKCGLCGEIHVAPKHMIYKQIGGVWKRLLICDKCKAEYDRELEMSRENFRRQFGEK